MLLPKLKPWRSPAYLAFIRSQKCCVCSNPESVAHHEQAKGCGGKGTRTHDHRTVPLCTRCHTLRHGIGRSWWDHINHDPEAIIARLQGEWVKKGGSLPKESPL